jgi:hypothetical protein
MTLTVPSTTNISVGDMLDIYDVSGSAILSAGKSLIVKSKTSTQLTFDVTSNFVSTIETTADYIAESAGNYVLYATSYGADADDYSSIESYGLYIEDCSAPYYLDANSQILVFGLTVGASNRSLIGDGNRNLNIYNNIIMQEGTKIKATELETIYLSTKSSTDSITIDLSESTVSQGLKVDTRLANGTKKTSAIKITGNGTDTQSLDFSIDVRFLSGTKLQSSNSVAASSVATVVKAHPIYDSSGNLLGYIPIYSSYS